MRIALFTESYEPVINGVASAVRWLAEALRAQHEVVVYAPHFPGHRRVESGVVRLGSYRLPGYQDYPLAYPFSPGGFRDFARRRFDVVHTHSPFTLGQAGRRWARRVRIPVVTTYHTLYVEYSHYAPYVPAGVVRAWLRLITRSNCNLCDAVAVPTEPIREVLQSYGVARPVSVIPTGLPRVPPAAPDPGYPRAALGLPPEAPLILYAGRLAREKNLELLFAAFRRVAEACPAAHLLVAGGGLGEAALEEARALAAAAGVAGRVTFAGFIPPERLRRCYAAATALAFTSLTDTQGLVIIEAKSAGLPVVSVDAYGPATVVRDGVDGFLVPDDPGAFAGALLRLLAQPEERARLSAAALQDAARFRIETTAERYLELYEGARRAAAGAPSAQLQGDRVRG